MPIFGVARRNCVYFEDAWEPCLTRFGTSRGRKRFKAGSVSPFVLWTCLGGLLAALAVLGVVTAGFPATRNLIQTATDRNSERLIYVWLHPSVGGGDQGLPPDVVPAWAAGSRLLEGVAPFVIGHRELRDWQGRQTRPLIIKTQASLFQVLHAKPMIGQVLSTEGVVLTYRIWKSMFHGDGQVLRRKVRLGSEWYRVAAVMPANFRFLSRQPAVFLIEPVVPDKRVMVAARIKPGVSEKKLDAELTRIAETACYYFLRSQLRYSFPQDAVWTPVRSFFVAAFATALLLLAVSRFSLRRLQASLQKQRSTVFIKRAMFFSAKLTLAFLVVFVAALEWSRSDSAVLYASQDPATGPFLLWLYILGTMGVLFWSVADQRVRCRVCLRLMCLPVRVGCPGCLLLDWSGTELLCTEGHGILHVPHLAASWDEDSERWISLDESWKSLFAETK
ncbi:MAG: ABC transporter permease [Acidobacteriota bacterium]|nr:ABC transporter permease [Acidobacteriota bacterium]